MPDPRSHADDPFPQNLRRSPAQGVVPAGTKPVGTRGPLPPVPKIDSPEPPSGLLPGAPENPRQSPPLGVTPAKAKGMSGSRSGIKSIGATDDIAVGANPRSSPAQGVVPVKARAGGGSKHNLKALPDDDGSVPGTVPVKSKPGGSRSHLKAIADGDDAEGTGSPSRPMRKKIKRGGAGGNDPALDKDTAKLIKNIWRQAVNENTTPGQTIKSLKTAFALASPSEAGPSGTVQRFAEAFPTADLGGYTIGDEIGRGGMGVVYKAYQQSLKRDVAIKLLLPEMASDPEHAAKFIAEALINAELSHPNIMPVYQIGQTTDGRKYMVMKLVIGISWWSILHPFTEAEKEVARKLELSDHLDLLLRTCDAVAYAHSRQIIHRDVKPDNVLVGQYGEVLLMDWGVAADLRPDLALDQYKAEPLHAINHPAGTPHYMAPEMARVDVPNLGRATDLYLLGATLYEILTNRPPHQAKETMDILIEAAKNTVLDREEPNVNRELMRIAKRAMATQPADRYPTVEAFAQAVREFRRHAESLQITESAAESLKIARNSRGARAYQYFSEALGGFSQALQLWPANDDAVAGRFEAISQHTILALESGDLALAESLINQWRAYARNLPPEQKKQEDLGIVDLSYQLNEARRQIKARKSTLAFAKFFAATLLAMVVLGGGAAFFMIEGARNSAIEQRDKANVERQKALDDRANAMKAEMEEARAAAVIRQKTAELESALAESKADRATAIEENTKARESLAEAFASQADTRLQEKNFSAARLLYARSLQLIDNEHARQGLIQSGRPRVLWTFQQTYGTEVKPQEACSVRYSPDGTRVYLAMHAGNTNLYCFDASSGQVTWTASKLAGAGAICRRMDISRDGSVITLLFYETNGLSGSLAVLNARTGDVDHLWTLSRWLYFADLSPDGKLLAGSNDDGVQLIRLQDGVTLWNSKEATDRSSPCRFSADGKLLFICRTGSSLGVLDLEGHTVAGDWNYHDQTRNLRAAVVSRDGTRLLVAGREGDCGVYQLNPFQPIHYDTVHDSEAMAVDASGSNDLGASGSQSGEVLIWKQVNTRIVQRFQFANQPVLGVAFAPDERTLAIAGADGMLRIACLDLDQPKRVQTNRSTEEPARVQMKVSADGATAFLANWTGGPGQVCLEAISLETGAQRWSVRTPAAAAAGAETPPEPVPEGEPRQIGALSLSVDGKWIAAGDTGGVIRVFDATTGEPVARRSFTSLDINQIRDLAFGPDPEELLLLGSSPDEKANRRLALWNWKKDTLQAPEKKAFPETIEQVCWLPGRDRWYIGVFGTSFTLARDLTAPRNLPHWGNPAVRVSLDGKRIVGTFQDKGLCLLAGDDLQSQIFFDQSDARMEALSFSTDGNFLAAGSRDGSLLIWETTRGKLLCRLSAGARNCQYVSFLPGKLSLLVAGAGRAPLCLYDVSALEGTGDDHMRRAQIDLRRRVVNFSIADISNLEYKRLVAP